MIGGGGWYAEVFRISTAENNGIADGPATGRTGVAAIVNELPIPIACTLVSACPENVRGERVAPDPSTITTVLIGSWRTAFHKYAILNECGSYAGSEMYPTAGTLRSE
jgi:hypothetical protein